jgi:hypothetical protein
MIRLSPAPARGVVSTGEVEKVESVAHLFPLVRDAEVKPPG